ncbi:sensor histidine kinase response regulator [Geobacter metallireducens GS-15]|uniref:histidine kinase n=3 Tax=Geobacter metallireducens TaxID=28232 RepID=Q39US8_GEOMG|nr:ATP-binding protein [Geobacter grbiciae]ABB31996.1 sensor histidine kinase response regulator [Geobacter metallireducens GS-15]
MSRLGVIIDLAICCHRHKEPAHPLQAKYSASRGTPTVTQTGTTAVTDADRIVELEHLLVELKAELAERKNIERDLKRAKVSAEAACHSKEDLLALVSHEIRSQIQMLTGAVELLRETPLDKKQTEYLNAFNHAGEFLLSLVNDLLDNSRLDAGRIHLDQIEFPFRELLERTAQLIAWQAGRKGLELEYHLSPDIPAQLVGDPKRLQQVILNLAGNAIKFTEQGKIIITVEPEASSLASQEMQLIFTIQDTGIGIPGDKLEEIFERYAQASPATFRTYGGTGLGLNIAKRLVGLMGGTIRVTSKEGKGTSFVFNARLGVTPPLLSSAVERRKSKSLPERSLRILLAEDAAEIRMLLGAFLGTTSHAVDMAHNGEEALKKFTSSNYDVIIMDIQMPVMDGLSATRKIREWERTHDRTPVPVVALTAGPERSDYLRAREAGCTTHLAKPIKKELLLNTISAVVLQ